MLNDNQIQFRSLTTAAKRTIAQAKLDKLATEFLVQRNVNFQFAESLMDRLVALPHARAITEAINDDLKLDMTSLVNKNHNIKSVIIGYRNDALFINIIEFKK